MFTHRLQITLKSRGNMCQHFYLTCVEIRFCCKLQQFCCSYYSSFNEGCNCHANLIEFWWALNKTFCSWSFALEAVLGTVEESGFVHLTGLSSQFLSTFMLKFKVSRMFCNNAKNSLFSPGGLNNLWSHNFMEVFGGMLPRIKWIWISETPFPELWRRLDKM
jgi:hypothetical protein